MKKVGIFLLAVFTVFGLSGCSDSDNELTVADMAGTYTLVSMTETPAGGSPVTSQPPTVTGTLTLSSSGSWVFNLTTPKWTDEHSGTFTVDDPAMVFTFTDGTGNAPMNGIISDDGRTVTTSATTPSISYSFIFAKQ